MRHILPWGGMYIYTRVYQTTLLLLRNVKSLYLPTFFCILLWTQFFQPSSNTWRSLLKYLTLQGVALEKFVDIRCITSLPRCALLLFCLPHSSGRTVTTKHVRSALQQCQVSLLAASLLLPQMVQSMAGGTAQSYGQEMRRFDIPDSALSSYVIALQAEPQTRTPVYSTVLH